MARYYNRKVNNRYFDESDLVLRKDYENIVEEKACKLNANWEGPYIVSKITKPGVYELLEMDSTEIMELNQP